MIVVMMISSTLLWMLFECYCPVLTNRLSTTVAGIVVLEFYE